MQLGWHPVAAGQYTFTHKQYNLGSMQAVNRLCEFYPGICLTTEGVSQKNLSQGSRRGPVGTMETESSFR